MHVCVGRGAQGGSEEGEVQFYGLWNIQIFLLKLEMHSLKQQYFLIPVVMLSAHMKTKQFGLCDKSCAFPGAQCTYWGPTLRWGLNIRQLHTCCAHGRAAWGVWPGAGPGCLSREEGFFQAESSKLNFFRFIWNWVWRTLKVCMTDF